MVFHGFGPKLAIFSSFYLGQENVFYNILERKIAFVGYKNERFKKSKKSKNFILGNRGPEKVFDDVVEQKKELL